MTPEETETTMTYDKGRQLVQIFTAWPKDQRKLERAGLKPLRGEPDTGLFYEVPLNRLKWRIRATQGRTKRMLGQNHPFRRQKAVEVGVSE